MIMVLLGSVTVRLSATDLYLNYVKEPMRPLLLIAGAFLLVVGFWSLISATRPTPTDAAGSGHRHGSDHGHDHSRGPRVAWLLLIPTLAVFLIMPPPLGADAAANDSGVAGINLTREIKPLPPGDPVEVPLDDYVLRAFSEDGESLAGRTVILVGFASPRQEGGWYLTRFLSSCCAADAGAIKVQVLDAPSPPIDQWVQVQGRYEPLPPDSPPDTPPQVRVVSVTEIEPPRDTYL